MIKGGNIRYLVLSIILLISGVNVLFSQIDSAYALRGRQVNSYNYIQLIKINTATGLYDTISPFYSCDLDGKKALINPYNNTYNLVGVDNKAVESTISFMDSIIQIDPNYNIDSILDYALNPKLYSINLYSGSMSFDTLDLTGRNMLYIEFNHVDSSFYYLTTGGNTTLEINLFKLNINGISTKVNSFPIPFLPYMTNGDYPHLTALNTSLGHLYIHGYPSSVTQQRRIYTIDISSGTILDNYIINDPDAIHQLTYNSITDSTYALNVVYSPNQRSIVAVNTDTWVTTHLSANVYDVWYIYGQAPAISSDGEKYFFLGYDNDNPLTGFRINTFDLQTGDMTQSDIINDIDKIMLIATKGQSNFLSYVTKHSLIKCEFEVISTSENLKVQSSDNIKNITLYNINGQIMGKWNVYEKLAMISISNLKKGIYLVKTEAGNCTAIKKVLIR